MLLDFIFLFFLTDRDHSLTANRCYTRLITFPPLTKRFFYFSPVEHIKGVYCNCGFGTSSMKIRLIECQPVTVCKLVAGNTLSNPESHSHCSFLNVMTVAFNVSVTHPRRPRGSQSDREKRRDESFQVLAKEPLGTDFHRAISKTSSGCRLLIGHKKCFVLLCPIGEQLLLSSFREFVHDGYCFDHRLSGSCTKEMHAVRKLSV